ncbi:PREDICTED: solute carrier family 26 member 10-like [Ceratosolen solmsi marchali]|uniref:Solute carrier family 26 member 10-like n=1 Tax=Ceratosolen solmsi marchali TaxID=326594 RepID=A0AAJ6YHE5_9HYME|nr:PREDICTED: solute carrier family 26 member 10-like [Ceratosolen solmsi marchali]
MQTTCEGNLRKDSQIILKLDVQRPVLEEQDLRQLYQYEKPKISVIETAKKSIESLNFETCIQNVIPASYWLRKYKWKNDFIYDVMSGITVAIMHIPQGMAYAFLANLSPVVGIYMAFFPVLIYVIFGTSRHVSMGTFAIICLMTGKAITSYSTPLENIGIDNHTQELETTIDSKEIYTPMQVATSVTFMVGIIQLIMYVMRLGVISTLLSETFVNGFTTGATIHVLLSQIFDLIGLDSVKPNGNFKFFKTVAVIFNDISNANTAAIIVSAIAICLMILSNELLKSWIRKYCSFPVPVELIAVITGTVISHYCEFSTKYNIKTVGYIPTGLPKPQLPAFSLLPTVVLESIEITMVSYTVTMSMSLIFAKKLHYKVDSNQELFAMGSSNIFGAFFSCMPISASLSRSLIQQTVGGKSQLASVVSCLIILVILLWIGPFFEALPKCILASIIVVALKGLLFQAKELIKIWKLSKVDGIIWIITFLSTALINIDIGLISGLLASIATVLFQSIKPYSCLLGHVPNTELYLDTSRYVGVAEIFGLKIFHYAGSINFVNANQLISDLRNKVGVKPSQIQKYRTKLAKKGVYVEPNDFDDKITLKCIVIDMSAVSKIDSSGVRALRDIVADFSQIDVHVYLAACSGIVFDMIQKCDLLEKGELTCIIFATVHDAVYFVQREHMSKST